MEDVREIDIPDGEYMVRIERCSERKAWNSTLQFVVEMVFIEPRPTNNTCEYFIDFGGEDGPRKLKRFLLAAKGYYNIEENRHHVNETFVEAAVSDAQPLAEEQLKLHVLDGHYTWFPGFHEFERPPKPISHPLSGLFASLTWHEVHTPWRTFAYGDKETGYKSSGLARPGIVLRFKDGDTVLIGDINELGGVCDDCRYGTDEDMRIAAWADIEELKRDVYFSDRGHRLAYTDEPKDWPVLTCELYLKWYALYLVEPDGAVRQAPIDIEELEQYAEGESVVGDHCWNPYVLQRLADAKDWLIDDVSFDLMVGRWVENNRGGLGQ